jgi:hypothetical protein
VGAELRTSISVFPDQEGSVFPVERPISGGILVKKPQPRDYGFSDESEVRRIISGEKKRIEKLHRIRFFCFFVAFLIVSGLALGALRLFFPSFDGGDGAHFLRESFLVVVSAATGLVLGMSFSLVAGALSRKILPPSVEYGKAKEYYDANWMWKRRLQREYGYQSY